MGFFGEFAGALFGNLAGRGRGRGRGHDPASDLLLVGHGRGRGWAKGRARRAGLKRRKGLQTREHVAFKLSRLEARPNCGWFCQRQKSKLAAKLASMPAPATPTPPPSMNGYFGDWSYLR